MIYEGWLQFRHLSNYSKFFLKEAPIHEREEKGIVYFDFWVVDNFQQTAQPC